MRYWVDVEQADQITSLDQEPLGFDRIYSRCTAAELLNLQTAFGIAETCDITPETPAGWKRGDLIYRSGEFWGGFYIYIDGSFVECARSFMSYWRFMQEEPPLIVESVELDLPMKCMTIYYETLNLVGEINKWDREGF